MKRTRKGLLGRSDEARLREVREAEWMMATRRKMCCPLKREELEKIQARRKLHTANHSAQF